MPRIFILLTICMIASLQPASSQQPDMALTNAYVHPVSSAPFLKGTVLISQGKIAAVGTHVRVPAGVRVIDLHGAVVTPGLIDARSSLFVKDEDLVGAGTADQSVLDAANLFDADAAKVLAAGVTTLYLSPGSRGGVGGTGAIVKLRPPSSGQGEGWANVFRREAALELSIGISTNGRSSSLERLNSFEALRSLFRGAQQYARAQVQYERELKEFLSAPPQPVRAGTPPAAGAPAAPTRPVKPRKSPANEIVLQALNGKIPVRIEAHRVDDILNALRLSDEFHFKLVLESATEADGLAREIARRKVPVIWGPTLPGGTRLETRNHNPQTAAILNESHVTLALSPSSRVGTASQFMMFNAQLAVGQGLFRGDALRTVTLDAAKALGIADRVGSIEVGKDADLIVFSTDPTSAEFAVKRILIEGKEVSLPSIRISARSGPNRAATVGSRERTGG